MLQKLFVTFSLTLLSPAWSQTSLTEFSKGPKGCVPGHDGTNNMFRMQAKTKIDSMTDGTVFCEEGQAGAFPCNGIDLQSFLNMTDLFDGYGKPLLGVNINDIWGWTSPDTGNEYALLGTSEGTIFIDVTIATMPVVLGMLPTHTLAANGSTLKHIPIMHLLLQRRSTLECRYTIYYSLTTFPGKVAITILEKLHIMVVLVVHTTSSSMKTLVLHT